MINHSPASVLMPFHVYSQKTVHLEFSLVRGFNSETTELKSKELLRHHFLAKNHGKTCKSSTVEIWNLCASCGSAAAVDAVELCEAQFFLAQRIALFFVEAKCGRKIREKGTQPCHNVAFCFEVTIMGGDRGGKALKSSWSPSIPCAVHLKRLLRVLCSFSTHPCRQMEAMEREAGWWSDADFVTRFLEKEMTEVAGSMKERTVTKAGQFYDDHLWSHMDHHGLHLTPPRQCGWCGWCDRFKSRPLAQRETQWSDGSAQRGDVTERVVLGTWMYLVLVVFGCSKVEMVGKQVQASKKQNRMDETIMKHHETYQRWCSIWSIEIGIFRNW